MKMTHFITAKRSSVRLLTCIGLAALMSCSNSSSPDAYPDSADGTDAAEMSVVAATNSGESAEGAAVKNLVPHGETTEINALTSSTQVSDDAVVMPVSNDNVAYNSASTGIEEGMPYIQARTILIEEGWIPLEQPEPGPYGVERTMYDLGVREVTACSGTGAGACGFSFYRLDSSRPNGHMRFGVTTYGGSKVEVASWGANFVEGSPPLLASAQGGNQPGNSQAVSAQPTNVGGSAIAQQQSVVPVQFRGKWNFTVEECSVPYSLGRLHIQGDRLSFYESSGPVTAVTTSGEYEMTVTTELSSEGTTFSRVITFQLAEDYSSITDVENNVIRYRCPD